MTRAAASLHLRRLPQRLAWRRWPPAGTPAWEAANELHEAVLQWAGGTYASIEKALEELEPVSEANTYTDPLKWEVLAPPSWWDE